MTPTDVIYHGGCPDGFTAAWAVTVACPGVRLHAGAYGTPPPDLPPDARVAIVDFSYPRDVLVGLAESVEHVLVLDHHASAERDLAGLGHPAVTVVFDMDRSGAMITWQHFHGAARPELVAYVQDRDLWRFDLSCSHEIGALIMATPHDLDEWGDLADRIEDEFLTAVDQGRAVNMFRERLIDETVKLARPAVIAGVAALAAPAPYLIGSDVAGRLAAMCETGVGAYWIDWPTDRQWGLRSTPAGPDVSVIAGRFRGGGHKHAAGFRILGEALDNVVRVEL